MTLALRFFDFFLVFFYLPAAMVSWMYRRCDSMRLPICSWVTRKLKILPIRSHYYEPAFTADALSNYTDQTPRNLPQVPWKESLPSAIEWLKTMRNDSELLELGTGELSRKLNFDSHITYTIKNGSFEKADAEVLYLFLRKYAPKKIIEIGSGNSTKVMLHAQKMNALEKKQHTEIICIEPFEVPALEKMGVLTIRKKVENCELELFDSLEAGDLLFIDSSHVLKPGGDLLFLYQQVIPRLKPGVFVHVHDIFLPYDYPAGWVVDRMWLWNEQYILEMLLAKTEKYKIICPLNALVALEFNALDGCLPWVKKQQLNGAGSFWFQII